MEQKQTWLRFLITGISTLLLLSSSQCGKTIVEPIKTYTYVYKNETGLPIEMYIRSYSFDPGQESFTIANSDSIVFQIVSEGPAPLAGDSFSSEVTDSVGIKFGANKCLSYTRDGQHGVFRFPEYEEYTNDYFTVNKEFYLTYIFDAAELNKAIDCN